ncbi:MULTISPECIES: aminotransferase-like domain-containing protein [Pantoea]|jgi:2-aminoadipate transaminase|nr:MULTISPECIES: PLP-dependent aminotransferase family protein [Pantoea]HCW98830.1 GntR family transcriptional regulator [Pantoea sp.]MBZ6384611.1 PLP-dependent aminotransferase family protein [Pantoea piersonii]MBZ6398216.1 PLP-dependent aminotransferase family protein [Pantoea piersonii]MBZ6406922.1 PLP-dependent aminotransferase family protein [Pantoea piersonii]MBZ6425201.1 PLP-dependent aminotransferase family protein [Pantoea piersonii]
MLSHNLAHRVKHLQSSAIRELLKHSKMEGVISLGGGIPNPDLFDTEGLQIAMDRLMTTERRDAFQYGLSEGDPKLREAIAQIMSERGIDSTPDDIVVTSGSQQSLDLLARALINPGDTIVVERPTYLAALQVFQLAEARLASVGTDGEGMIVDELEELVKRQKIKAVYIVPTFGNPSGVTLSASRRQKLVALAQEHDFIIFEDDPYSEINFTNETFRPLKSFAQEMKASDRVIYTSTFSKILAPGARVGWISLPDWLKQQVVILKQATDLHTSSLSQSLTRHYLETGRLTSQIDLIRTEYKKKCDALCAALQSEMGERIRFHRPLGGMFLWATFNYEFNTTEWLKSTLQNGVVYVPGEFFYCDNPDKSTLRLSYVTVSEDNLLKAAQRLNASLP